MKYPYSSSPPASYVAVKKVIEAMGGVEEQCDLKGWLVTFPDEKSMNDASVLIEMLNGWEVTEDLQVPNKVKVFSRS